MNAREKMRKYNEAGLEGHCFVGYPYSKPMLELPDNSVYVPPDNETDAEFLDRLERAKACEDAFRNEWKRFHRKKGTVS